MKLKMALAAAALTVLGASSAQAQLSIVLDSPTLALASAPDFAAFNGTIFNIGTSPITIDGESLSAPAGVTPDLPNSDVLNGIAILPLTLNPGESLRGDYLFALDVPGGQGDFDGFYGVTGLDATGAPVAFSTPYAVRVGTPVPEPGSMALILGSMVGGSALLMRRRRK